MSIASTNGTRHRLISACGEYQVLILSLAFAGEPPLSTRISLSIAGTLTTMKLIPSKVPGYALASTFVALGGILNG